MAVDMFGNINGYSYQPPDRNLIAMGKAQQGSPVRFKDTELGKDMSAIKVSISAEGLRALHGTNFSGSVDIKAEQEKIKFASEHQPIEGFRNRLSRTMQEGMERLRQNAPDRQISLSEKEEILMKEFRNIVDEISSGYDKGTRIRFIQDSDSNDGYKKLSKEDELSILKQEFDSFVNDRFGEKHQKESEEVAKAINRLQEIKQQRGISNVRYYQPEKIPDGFVDRVLKSAGMYISRLK